ncbi:YscW family type III secretion system pilotin [Shewanella sp. SR44-3]|uniref:YscW family type III secretion system pilotin n=1 Tax=Shewanella sp. SR44-3 TaxID=2760936 RepID=UPI0015FD26EE|nr:YscW family type III secretion system pilotin [Shewanella sp. SR44-3]MBB1268996.1 YscW family type III secretion system pilotin [Shewanella sp. SR44-3]
MKLNHLSVILLPWFLLTACVDVSVTKQIPAVMATNQDNNQPALSMQLNGWLSFDAYVPSYNSSLTVILYMQHEGVRLPVARQTYQNSQLPVRYSFAVAPIQAGQGLMQIEAKLTVEGKLIASISQEHQYQLGATQLDLKLLAAK